MRRPGSEVAGRVGQPPAQLLVAAGAISVQFGAAVATHLFGRVGPSGAVSLRLGFAALILGAVAVLGRGGWRGVRAAGPADLGVAALFGLVLGGMNLSFYEGISRIPLGVGVTVEFVGPLTVSLLGSRRRSDLVWAVLAAAGVVLLAGGVGHHLDPVGVGLTLLAGAFWAGYILLSKETGRRFPGAAGLTVAMVVATAVVLPVGAAHAGGHLFEPGVLGMGLAVAMLSSVLPYSLELAALRRLTPRAFGILMSAEPAVAAVAGLVVLGQHLAWAELVALGLVVAANVGSTLSDRAPAPTVGEGKSAALVAVGTGAERIPPN